MATDKDAQERRDTAGRWTVLLLGTTILLVGLPLGVYLFSNWFFGLNWLAKILGIAAFAGFGELYAHLLPRKFLAIVPQAQGLITENEVGGDNIPYGPGTHVSYPWESVEPTSNISLETITQTFTLTVPSLTSKVTATGVFQFQVDGKYMENVVGVDESTVVDGYTGVLKSFLTARFAGKKAEDCAQDLEAINQLVHNQVLGAGFGQRYGIKPLDTKVSTIELPEAVQKSRDARDEAEVMFDIVAKVHGMEVETLKARIASGEIKRDEYHRMLQFALSISDNAKMTININEGTAAQGIAAAFGKLVGGNQS